jgi:hypothetical protein
MRKQKDRLQRSLRDPINRFDWAAAMTMCFVAHIANIVSVRSELKAAAHRGTG